MTSLIVILIVVLALLAGYLTLAIVRADGAPVGTVLRDDLDGVKNRPPGGATPVKPPSPTDFFGPGRRNQAGSAPARVDKIFVPAEVVDGGEGRVKNPNAPCWLCGQLKAPDHKCN